MLNVDQYKKANKKDLVERLVKGRQLKDESKDVLLGIAQNEGIKVNASMSKNVILQKITNPKLTDLKENRLRKIAEKKGIPLRTQLTNRAIIQRLENPTDYYTVESLKRLARSNNIDVRRNISKPELINILGERNLITTTPITAQESNLGVLTSKVPIDLIREAKKKKTKSAKEALENLRKYIKVLKYYKISANILKKLSKQLEKKEKKEKEERDKIFTPILEASAFKNYTNQYVINNIGDYKPDEVLAYAKPAILNIFKSNRNIKTMLYLHCTMKREQGYDEEDEGYDDVKGEGRRMVAKFAFHSRDLKLVLEETDISELYDEMTDEIEEGIQKANDEGSNLVFGNVVSLVLHTTKWEPIYGSSYIPLDPYIANKKAIINMKNEDDKCFMWCVLRALYPKDKNAERIDKDLKSKQDIINMKGICYPVNFRAIDRFEDLNPNISISVLGYNKEDRVFPLRISKYTGCDYDIVLLLLKEAKKGENGEIKEKTHYTLVKNMSALIASQKNNHKGKRHVCLNCFNSFDTLESLNKHKEYCYENESIKTNMPPQNTYLSDPNMLLMFEKGIRGGISIISNRYGEANNKYMRKGFNKNKPSKYLMYLDANNLYGCGMSEKLPTHGFKWLSDVEMEKFLNNQVLQVWEKIPCILEVDLEYPENLHDLHNDYPFCPEKVKCKNRVEKLIPNLRDKTKYIIHYKNLIQCLRAGMKLKKIHRGIKFVESEWLKPYIDKNTNLRAKAKNNFEKDFFKLMNNSVFGKTMENIRNRVDVKLVNTKEKLRKLVAKPNFKGRKIFNENLVSVHMKKTSLTMNKPIYLGMCILDLSKIIMFDFHYNYIKSKYADKAKLLFTDTDSLMYEIETEDFYKDISGDVKDRFDTSDYPENHPSGIPTGENKKVLGMMKDEAAGKIIKEFVGLRSKLYSFVMDDGGETKKCKGIKKQVVKRSIRHEDYKTCLTTGKELLRKQNILRSYEHEVYTEEVNKVALSALDDKRYILSDGMDTLAWGHYKIQQGDSMTQDK